MSEPRLRIGAGALLTVAALYFFCGWRIVAAALLAALVHEAGHVLALRLCGVGVAGLRCDAAGLCILCRGALSTPAEALCIAAGPLFGLIFAFAASAVETSFSDLTAGVSLLLSVFNLLPAMPLDGGRLLGLLATPGTAASVSLLTALSLLVCGGALAICGDGPGLLVAGIWITLAQADL